MSDHTTENGQNCIGLLGRILGHRFEADMPR